MLNAFLISALAQSTLLLSGLFVYWVKVPSKIIGWLAGRLWGGGPHQRPRLPVSNAD